MSLFCKQCGKTTDMLAEGYCINCYREKGYDSEILPAATSLPAEPETNVIKVEAKAKPVLALKETVSEVSKKEPEPVEKKVLKPELKEDQHGQADVLKGVYARVQEMLEEDKKAKVKKSFFCLFREKIIILEETVARNKILSWGGIALLIVLTVALFGKQIQSGLEIYSKASLLLQSGSGSTANEQVIDRNLDSDGDGIPDFKEIEKFHTDPYNADSDNDGVSDRDEILQGTDPAPVENVIAETPQELPTETVETEVTDTSFWAKAQAFWDGIVNWFKNIWS